MTDPAVAAIRATIRAELATIPGIRDAERAIREAQRDAAELVGTARRADSGGRRG